MWMPCVPGGSCVSSTSMRTPSAAAAKVAVPIFWPVALTMSACADGAICADDFCAAVVRADADGSAVVAKQKAAARIAVWIFMGVASVAVPGWRHLRGRFLCSGGARRCGRQCGGCKAEGCSQDCGVDFHGCGLRRCARLFLPLL